VAAAPNNAEARAARSVTLNVQRRFEEARREAERAIALEPARMEGRSSLCSAFYGEGLAEDAIACVDTFIRLSPRDPVLSDLLIVKAGGYLMEGKDAQALQVYRQSASLNPNYPICHAYLAATLALVGKNDEAREALARYLSLPLTHTKTVAAFKKQRYSENPAYLAMRERIYAGLRKAGMPEQ
jgi:adenylate cyclase